MAYFKMNPGSKERNTPGAESEKQTKTNNLLGHIARNAPKVFANTVIRGAQKALKGNQRRVGKPAPGSKDYFKIEEYKK